MSLSATWQMVKDRPTIDIKDVKADGQEPFICITLRKSSLERHGPDDYNITSANFDIITDIANLVRLRDAIDEHLDSLTDTDPTSHGERFLARLRAGAGRQPGRTTEADVEAAMLADHFDADRKED